MRRRLVAAAVLTAATIGVGFAIAGVSGRDAAPKPTTTAVTWSQTETL